MEAVDRSAVERLHDLELTMCEASFAVLELAKLANMHTQAIAAVTRQRARQRWWNRALLFVVLMVLVRLLTACGGAAFGSSSPDGSPLAGAQSSAGALAAGGSAGPSGGAAGVAGGNTAGKAAGAATTGGAGAAGAAGAAGDESAGAAAIGLPCGTSAWKASAFASRAAPPEPPELAVDGDTMTRWSSGQARAAGQWFQLELGAGVVLEQLELSTPASPDDVPSSLELEIDSKRVDAAAVRVGGVLRLTFDATAATSLRLVLAAAAPSWWSISEIEGLCQ